jgi:hypothetical protein
MPTPFGLAGQRGNARGERQVSGVSFSYWESPTRGLLVRQAPRGISAETARIRQLHALSGQLSVDVWHYADASYAILVMIKVAY